MEEYCTLIVLKPFLKRELNIYIHTEINNLNESSLLRSQIATPQMEGFFLLKTGLHCTIPIFAYSCFLLQPLCSYVPSIESKFFLPFSKSNFGPR